jgi:hypothetical protein
VSPVIEHGRADTPQSLFELLVIHGVSLGAYAHQLNLHGGRFYDGAARIALQRQPGEEIVAGVVRQKREHRFARRRAIDLRALACPRQRMQVPAALDVRDRQQLGPVQDRDVRALARLLRNLPKVGLCVFTEFEPGDRALPQLDQPRSQPVCPFRSLLDEPVRLEHHEQPVHRALVQSKLPRDIGRGQIGFRIGDRLQYRDGSIEHLNPITGRRRLEPFSTCRRGLIHGAMIAGFPF